MNMDINWVDLEFTARGTEYEYQIEWVTDK